MRAVARKMPSGMALAFVGYVLYSVYTCTTFVSPTTISSVVEIGYLPKALYLFFIILGRMVGLAVLAIFLMRRRRQPPLAASVAASAACAFVGFASMALVFQLTWVVDLDLLLPWFFASGVWIGLGDAFVIVLWFSYLSRYPIRLIYLFLVGSTVVGSVLYITTTLLPVPLPWFIAVVSFFGSLSCCAYVLKKRTRLPRDIDVATDRQAFRRLARPLLGVVLMAFMAGLMMNVAGQEKISLETYQRTAFVIMFSLNLALLLPALFAPQAFKVPRLYKFILPLSALGFLLLPLVWDAIGRGMVNSFVQVGFTFTNVIFYCLIAEECRSADSASPLKTFCLMQLVVMGANFVGLFVAFFGIGYLEPGDITLTILALVAVYLILIVTLVLFKDKSLVGVERGRGKDKDSVLDATSDRSAAEEASRLSQRAEELIGRSGLSVREREVLDHLRQGRAPKTIAKLLFVSENTVRFHIRNIYQKFDVHSRTELMELFDEGLHDSREEQEGTAL